jgi:hypothetical protein
MSHMIGLDAAEDFLVFEVGDAPLETAARRGNVKAAAYTINTALICLPFVEPNGDQGA